MIKKKREKRKEKKTIARLTKEERGAKSMKLQMKR